MSKIVKYYNSLADNHIELAQYDSAYYYLQKAKKLDTGNQFIDLTYLNIGRYYRDKPSPNYSSALDTFQLSLQETINVFGKKHNYVAIGNMHIGRTHFLQKNYEKALQNYQKAIHIFVPSFTDTTDFYKNPQKLFDL